MIRYSVIPENRNRQKRTLIVEEIDPLYCYAGIVKQLIFTARNYKQSNLPQSWPYFRRLISSENHFFLQLERSVRSSFQSLLFQNASFSRKMGLKRNRAPIWKSQNHVVRIWDCYDVQAYNYNNYRVVIHWFFLVPDGLARKKFPPETVRLLGTFFMCMKAFIQISLFVYFLSDSGITIYKTPLLDNLLTHRRYEKSKTVELI